MLVEQSYHIGFNAGHGARYAILPGDPGRVERIAQHLDEAAFFSQSREYTAWMGKLEGQPVLVMSTGMGGPSTAIAVEELYRTGVDTFIRVGTCGGMQPDVMAGDLVIASGDKSARLWVSTVDADECDGVGDGDASEACAVEECVITDAGDGVGDCDAGEA